MSASVLAKPTDPAHPDHPHHQHHTTLKWLRILRVGLLSYTVVAGIFFLVTGANLAFNILPNKDAEDTTLIDTLGSQFHFLIQEVSGWLYVAITLSVLGLVMSVFGFAAFKSKRLPLIQAYFVWSALHLLLYAGTMLATIILMARENPGTHVVSDPKPISTKDAERSWIVLLTVLLPDWTLWTVVRAAVCYLTWVYFTEVRMLKRIIAEQEGLGAAAASAEVAAVAAPEHVAVVSEKAEAAQVTTSPRTASNNNRIAYSHWSDVPTAADAVNLNVTVRDCAAHS
ncbi:hypothetical protein BC828DRAFT_401947 [Blastocladiella britannica]|nr:hypothetical protein BC828DRAFT_401947 [Blastocladiella britannica]